MEHNQQQLQKTSGQNSLMQVSRENWQSIMKTLPVKADMTAREVVRVESAPLALLNVGTGNSANSQAVLAVLLLELTNYFGHPWNKTQIAGCTELWSQEYHWMTQAEVKHFLTKCKAGAYTKDDFRNLSPFQLMGWLEEYASELLVERARLTVERQREAEKRAIAERDNDPTMVEVDFSALKAMLMADRKTPEELAAPDPELIARRDAMIAAAVQEFGAEALAPPDMEPEYEDGDGERVADLARRISAGDHHDGPEDVQLASNYPRRLEAELKSLQPAA